MSERINQEFCSWDKREIRRVVLLRALQLGDLLCAVPAFRALRMALPEAHIALVGLPWAAELVQRLDYIDEFIAFPGVPGFPETTAQPLSVPPFLAAMKQRRFNLAIQMHGNGSLSNPFIRAFGASRAAGYYDPRQEQMDGESSFLPYPEQDPEVLRHLKLMTFLGAPSQGEHLEFPLAEEDRAALRKLPGFQHGPPKPFVCVHPGARSRTRRWDVERFAQAADAMFSEGFQITLTGSAGERNLAAEVAGAMDSPALNLAGMTTLGSLAALVDEAALIISNDTGISHLAAALETPSVIVFTASDPIRWAPLDRKIHRIVQATTPEDRHLSLAAVLREADSLLEGNRHEKNRSAAKTLIREAPS